MNLRRTRSSYQKRRETRSSRTRLHLEQLEQRQLLTSVPFGALDHDVAEFLLGSVAVNVVFMESNGELDESTEDWTEELRAGVKENIEEALGWWEETLAMYTDVHQLDFTVDYTHADNPVETKYEPISRHSRNFQFWIEDFFRAVDVPSATGFTNEIRTYNHQQRLVHDTNWSFTIFVVNADADEDGQFGDELGRTEFRNAFAFPGGQFIAMPHHRPAQTIAHEIAHIFWAHDEYGGSGDTYHDRRGYYNTQNTNALDGNPDTSEREPSLMNRLHSPYVNHQLSQAARETLGWRDSDGDGIFDVLDVEPITVGSTQFDPETRTVRFAGNSAIRTLKNQNSSGSGRDMTLNKITDLQYRIDAGPWIDLVEYDQHNVTFDVTTSPIPVGSERVEFRTMDDRIGLASNRVGIDLPAGEPTPPEVVEPTNPADPEPVNPEPVDPVPTEPEPTEPEPTEPEPADPVPTEPEPTPPDPVEPQPTEPVEPVEPTDPSDTTESAEIVATNPANPLDTNGDGSVSAIDVLRVINAINDGNSVPTESGPPFPDVTGDGVVSSLDALRIINFINARSAAQQSEALAPEASTNESPLVDFLSTPIDSNAEPESPAAPTAVDAAFASPIVTRQEEIMMALLASRQSNVNQSLLDEDDDRF